VKDEEPEEKKSGPIIVDAAAWTGPQVTDADRLEVRELHQSPVWALGLLGKLGFVLVGTPIISALLAYALYGEYYHSLGAADGAPLSLPQQILRALSSLTVAGLIGLAILRFLRIILRDAWMPVLRGGFRRSPCIVIDDDGFIDHSILREPVQWEDIEDIREINATNRRRLDMTLKRPYQTRRGRLGEATTQEIGIDDSPYPLDDYSPSSVLLAHYAA